MNNGFNGWVCVYASFDVRTYVSNKKAKIYKGSSCVYLFGEKSQGLGHINLYLFGGEYFQVLLSFVSTLSSTVD